MIELEYDIRINCGSDFQKEFIEEFMKGIEGALKSDFESRHKDNKVKFWRLQKK